MLRTLVAALVAVLGIPSGALAAPAVVDVRVEGASRTLFEGPVRTDGHDIRAASDSRTRPCDGTNLDANPFPGPTATAATVDAMALNGRDFDGRWYPSYEDYFIQRFGPDREDGDTYAYWGILVGRAFTPVGGCQFRVGDGDEVLWAYDAFNGRPFLWLAGASAVAPGAPLTVTVERSSGAMDGAPADEGPAAGVRVAPVATDASGDQTVLGGGAITDADGQATLTFAEPGWHRVKAAADGFVRSNRLDVCVGACGPAPADTLVRELTPAPTPDPTVTPTPVPTVTPTPVPSAAPPQPTAASGPPAPLRLDAPRLTGGGARRGLIDVRWRVLDASAGIGGWTIESALASSTRWTRRASGTSAQSASLRLPAGRSYDLRFSIADALGRSSTTAIGRAVVPLDDRALRLRGWRRGAAAGAWRGTVSRGARGGTARVRLAAGRPLVLLRGATAGTRVQLAGRTFRVTPKTRTLTGARRAKAGTVSLRVLAGRIELDGVAVTP